MAAPLVGKRVVVDGLASKPELNGSKGTATSFDDAKGRYNIQMDAGGMLALKPANLLPDRTAEGVPGASGTQMNLPSRALFALIACAVDLESASTAHLDAQ